MPKKLTDSELKPSEVFPDPLSRAKAAVIGNRLTDMALAGDMPASRLFSDLTTAQKRDIWQEVRREREDTE